MVTHALLPPHLAAQFELRAAPRRARAGLVAFGAIYRRLPRTTTALPAFAEARRRLAGEPVSRFAAWTERMLAALAQRATGS